LKTLLTYDKESTGRKQIVANANLKLFLYMRMTRVLVVTDRLNMQDGRRRATVNQRSELQQYDC